MYLKDENVYITKNIKDLPLSVIEPGNHIVLLEKFTIEKMFKPDIVRNSVVNFAVFEIKMNKVFLLEGVRNSVDTTYEGYSSLETSKKIQRVLLSLKNNDVFIYEPGYDAYRDIEDDKLIDEIYKVAFEQKREISSSLFNVKFCLNEHNTINAIPVQLDENYCLVFALSHIVNIQKKLWSTEKVVYLVSRDKQMIELNLEFDSLFDHIRKEHSENYTTYNTYFSSFDESLELLEYDIEEYLNQSDIEREKSFFRIRDELLILGDYDKFKEFKTIFEPVYVNDDLGVKAYEESVRERYCDLNVFLTVNGVIVDSDPSEELIIEHRKATGWWRFNKRKTGFHPIEKLFYEDGELDEKKNSTLKDKTLYSDYEGLKIRNGIGAEYYKNYDGYFLIVGERSQDARDIDDREAMLKRLLEAQ